MDCFFTTVGCVLLRGEASAQGSPPAPRVRPACRALAQWPVCLADAPGPWARPAPSRSPGDVRQLRPCGDVPSSGSPDAQVPTTHPAGAVRADGSSPLPSPGCTGRVSLREGHSLLPFSRSPWQTHQGRPAGRGPCTLPRCGGEANLCSPRPSAGRHCQLWEMSPPGPSPEPVSGAAGAMRRPTPLVPSARPTRRQGHGPPPKEARPFFPRIRALRAKS